jgi:type II secretory pathway pseudopilin PulG
MHAATVQRGATLRAKATFTLVELMVAMALMTILTGSVVFIFMQAQEIFVTVDARVQVYQYSRYAFDQIERDLASVVKTRDMEFFNDQPFNPLGVRNHYDALLQEELPILGTGNSYTDPKGENLYDGSGTYNRAFTLRQPAPYEDAFGGLHRRDSIYFKTVTMVDGTTTRALIEYSIEDEHQDRPRLVKKLWRATGVDRSNPLAPRLEINGNSTARPVVQNLCLYATDVKFEAFIKNGRRSDSGNYYETKDLVDPPRRQTPGAGSQPVFEPLPSAQGWGGQNFMVQTHYDERWEQRPTPDLGLLEPASGGVPTLFHTQQHFLFPMLGVGDTIWLADVNATPAIKAQPYTIKAFVVEGTDPPQAWTPDLPKQKMRILFEEHIDTHAAHVQVTYKAAFTPPAVRVTLRVKDAKSRELRTVSRIFKILAN